MNSTEGIAKLLPIISPELLLQVGDNYLHNTVNEANLVFTSPSNNLSVAFKL